MQKRRVLGTGIGIVSIVLILVILFASFYISKTQKSILSVQSKGQQVRFVMEPETLIYEGNHALDLMEGVSIVSEDGSPLPYPIEAVLAPSMAKGGSKKIRYSAFDSDGQLHTATRELYLKGYTGPSIELPASLSLKAEELDNLILSLIDSNQLYAQDGFLVDRSKDVTWCRKKTGDHKYDITFKLVNMFADEAEKTIPASISGDVSDITLTLVDSSVTLQVGEYYDLLSFVSSATDPDLGDLTSRVTVSGFVDFNTPGRYLLTYQVISFDGTQMAEQYLNVTIV